MQGKRFPTFRGDVGEQQLKRERLGRRIIMSCLALFILVAATGALGVRTDTRSARGGGYELVVTYASVTRAGLATPWSVRVRREGGFEGAITVATSRAYFELFDENGLNPDPAAATTRGDLLVWEFDPPDGDTLSITYDARLGPSIQLGQTATTMVLSEGTPAVTVDYRTLVVP
jgi:hypothetical protein